jgi:fructose-1-phosphate kinase PfkB-like protein
MIVTVTPNPALDLTYTVPAIELGESHRVAAAAVRAGGKGLNVARVLHQNGHPVLALAPAGGRSGDEFAAELAASALPHHIVPVHAATRRSVALVDERAGLTTIFNEYGENHTPTEWQQLTDAVGAALGDVASAPGAPGARPAPAGDATRRVACLVGSGSLPAGADPQFYAALVELAAASGIPAVIDTSGPALLTAARAGATVLKPNRQELADATGQGDPLRGAQSLLDAGATLVLVSLGEDGMLAVSRREPLSPWRARLPRALAGNPTGAGDAAVAAVAACLAEGITDPESILRRATAWSAAAVLMPLAGEISPRHVELAGELVVDRASPPRREHP